MISRPSIERFDAKGRIPRAFRNESFHRTMQLKVQTKSRSLLNILLQEIVEYDCSKT